jgi:hypothetical protein
VDAAHGKVARTTVGPLRASSARARSANTGETARQFLSGARFYRILPVCKGVWRSNPHKEQKNLGSRWLMSHRRISHP